MTRLERYVGPDMCLDDLPRVVRRAAAVSMESTRTFYGDTVDGQMIANQVRLCNQTADCLYSDWTPLEVRYRPGSRPELERILDRILAGVTGGRERVLTIMRVVRDIHTLRPGGERTSEDDLFGGGLEEEVIKKGSNMCNEQARVFCVLCQVAGIPARYVGHYIDRHACAEAYVDGKWSYFDVEGRYFLERDGSFASAWELRRNPTLVTSQPPEVVADTREGFGNERSIREFCPVEVTVVINYFVWEQARYNHDWIWPTREHAERVRSVTSRFPEELDHQAVNAMIRGERAWPA